MATDVSRAPMKKGRRREGNDHHYSRRYVGHGHRFHGVYGDIGKGQAREENDKSQQAYYPASTSLRGVEAGQTQKHKKATSNDQEVQRQPPVTRVVAMHRIQHPKEKPACRRQQPACDERDPAQTEELFCRHLHTSIRFDSNFCSAAASAAARSAMVQTRFGDVVEDRPDFAQTNVLVLTLIKPFSLSTFILFLR